MAVVIVIHPPAFQNALCLRERGKLVDVQTLIAEPAVKRLNEGIFDGFAGSNEVELHAAAIAQSSRARDWNSVP